MVVADLDDSIKRKRIHISFNNTNSIINNNDNTNNSNKLKERDVID